MVKGVATSIITVAVLMGSLVACSGSDGEVAELRAEVEELKEAQNNESSDLAEKVPEPTPTSQTFFEYPEYGISIDFSTDEGAQKIEALTKCESDWKTLLDYIELIENAAGISDWPTERENQQMTYAELDFAIQTFKSYRRNLLLVEGGEEFVVRLGVCDDVFSEIFNTFLGSAPTLLLYYVDQCADLDRHPDYEKTISLDETSDRTREIVINNTWHFFDLYCVDLKDPRTISIVNEAFEELRNWAIEVQTERGER